MSAASEQLFRKSGEAHIGQAATVVTAATAAPAIADRIIRGDGTPEDAWQQWPALATLPLLSLDAWLPPACRLVVVSPHPDDEVLSCGGLLALHGERGGRSLLVAVTDGEASHAGSPRWDPRRLASLRCAESREGLARLSTGRIAAVRLRLADGAVAQHADALTRRLRGLLKPSDRVVVTWQLDGHPDHEASGRSATQACADAGCALIEAPVWMWHWATPDDPRVPWSRMCRLPLPPQVQARKRHAIAAHATQLGPRDGGEPAVLGAGILQRAARPVEYFIA